MYTIRLKRIYSIIFLQKIILGYISWNRGNISFEYAIIHQQPAIYTSNNIQMCIVKQTNKTDSVKILDRKIQFIAEY